MKAYYYIKTFFILAVILFNYEIIYSQSVKIEIEDTSSIFSVIIEKKEKIIFQKYFYGKNETDLMNIQGITKSIVSLLVGIAEDENFITDIDDPIEKYLKDYIPKGSDKGKITIKQILDQTSGLAAEDPFGFEKWYEHPNPTSSVLTIPSENVAGVEYKYNSSATHLISAIIEKSSGISTANFAEKYLFQPLGIDNYFWLRLKDGFYDGGGVGLWLTAKDLIKVGRLILNFGKYDDKEIIPEYWVDEIYDTTESYTAEIGLRNSKHHNCWYSTIYQGYFVIYAMGENGQFLFIIPDLESIIVVNHDHESEDGIINSTNFIINIFPELFSGIINSDD